MASYTPSAVAGAELRWAIDLAPVVALEPPRKEEPPRHNRLGPIVLGGSGILAAGIGTFFVVDTLGEASTIERECGTACPPERWESQRDQQLVGNVLIIAGAAALAGAAVWWVLQSGTAK